MSTSGLDFSIFTVNGMLHDCFVVLLPFFCSVLILHVIMFIIMIVCRTIAKNRVELANLLLRDHYQNKMGQMDGSSYDLWLGSPSQDATLFNFHFNMFLQDLPISALALLGTTPA